MVSSLSSPISPRERLWEVYRQLAGIGGGRSLGFGPNRVRSLPDGVAQALVQYLESASQDEKNPSNPNGGQKSNETLKGNSETPEPVVFSKGDLCPDCGQAAVVNEEGCRKCYSCGFSEC